MGGVYQGLGGAKPPMMILLGAIVAKPPPPLCMETFQYLNTLVLHPIIASAESLLYHPLFCPPPMNWIILCLAPP